LDWLQGHSGVLEQTPESQIRGPLTFTPPSKVAAPRSNGSGLEKSVEVCLADVSWGGWVFLVIFRDEVWHLDIGGHLPRVVLSAETFLLNQELEPPPVPAAIQYLLYLPFWFSINDNR